MDIFILLGWPWTPESSTLLLLLQLSTRLVSCQSASKHSHSLSILTMTTITCRLSLYFSSIWVIICTSSALLTFPYGTTTTSLLSDFRILLSLCLGTPRGIGALLRISGKKNKYFHKGFESGDARRCRYNWTYNDVFRLTSVRWVRIWWTRRLWPQDMHWTICRIGWIDRQRSRNWRELSRPGVRCMLKRRWGIVSTVSLTCP